MTFDEETKLLEENGVAALPRKKGSGRRGGIRAKVYYAISKPREGTDEVYMREILYDEPKKNGQFKKGKGRRFANKEIAIAARKILVKAKNL